MGGASRGSCRSSPRADPSRIPRLGAQSGASSDQPKADLRSSPRANGQSESPNDAPEARLLRRPEAHGLNRVKQKENGARQPAPASEPRSAAPGRPTLESGKKIPIRRRAVRQRQHDRLGNGRLAEHAGGAKSRTPRHAAGRSPAPRLQGKKMVVGAGFEPAKALPADLQSAPFGRFGTPPRRIGRKKARTASSAETREYRNPENSAGTIPSRQAPHNRLPRFLVFVSLIRNGRGSSGNPQRFPIDRRPLPPRAAGGRDRAEHGEFPQPGKLLNTQTRQQTGDRQASPT